MAIQENKKHRIEYGNLDIQLDQGGQTIDGFSEVDRLRVEVHIFDFGVGTHHGVLAPESDREHSIQNQMAALNVGSWIGYGAACTALLFNLRSMRSSRQWRTCLPLRLRSYGPERSGRVMAIANGLHADTSLDRGVHSISSTPCSSRAGSGFDQTSIRPST